MQTHFQQLFLLKEQLLAQQHALTCKRITTYNTIFTFSLPLI